MLLTLNALRDRAFSSSCQINFSNKSCYHHHKQQLELDQIELPHPSTPSLAGNLSTAPPPGVM